MADQLDFGVNWVKEFSVRRDSVFMDTFFFIQHGLCPPPSAVAPLYHVMQLTWLL